MATNRADLTDPATPRNIQPVVSAIAGVGDPIFSDEFHQSSLNTDKWDPWYPDTSFWAVTEPGGHKTNTDEPQGYDETGISFVTDGPDRFMRFTFHESNHAVPELDYTSGMVSSYPSFNTTYGVFEARIRVPNVEGSWPAFWRFPTDQGWPPEEDFFENWGRAGWNTLASSAYHRPRPTPGGYVDEEHTFPGDVGGVWRTITAHVEPGRFRTWFDGVAVMDYAPTPSWQKPMCIFLNLAGATSDGGAAAAASAPFSMDVDYVRAWALDGENVDLPPLTWALGDGTPMTASTVIDGELVPIDGQLYSTPF